MTFDNLKRFALPTLLAGIVDSMFVVIEVVRHWFDRSMIRTSKLYGCSMKCRYLATQCLAYTRRRRIAGGMYVCIYAYDLSLLS